MHASSLFIGWPKTSHYRLFCFIAYVPLWALACEHAQAQQRSQCLSAHADAQTLRMKGSLLAAHEQLLICSQTRCPLPIANDCASWLGEVDSSLSSVVFAVSDDLGQDIPDARVSVAGKLLVERTDGRALTLDPGTYTFTFEVEGHVTAEQTVSMRQSEKNRIVRVQMARIVQPKAAALVTASSDATHPGEPTSAARPASTAPTQHSAIPLVTYILGGTTLVGTGMFAYFGLSGASDKRRAEHCQTGCDDLIRNGKRDYVIADIGLGIAIASLPAAILVFALQPGDAPEAKSQLHVQPIALQHGAGMLWTGEF